jgi:hypothetical protein
MLRTFCSSRLSDASEEAAALALGTALPLGTALALGAATDAAGGLPDGSSATLTNALAGIGGGGSFTAEPPARPRP